MSIKEWSIVGLRGDLHVYYILMKTTHYMVDINRC